MPHFTPSQPKSELANLMSVAAGRITFNMSLDWDSRSDSFNVQVKDDFLLLGERFRAGDSNDPWLEFEAKAPNDPATSFTHIQVTVKFPWCFMGEGATKLALSKVNEMNLVNPGCSTCLEPETCQTAIRSLIGFAGYSTDTDEPLPNRNRVQIRDEVTLNMFAHVIGMAMGWSDQIFQLHAKLNRFGFPGGRLSRDKGLPLPGSSSPQLQAVKYTHSNVAVGDG